MKLKYLVLSLIFIFIFNSRTIFAQKLDYESIYSSSSVAIDADNGAVLFNKDGNKKIYPASTTKIVTAIIAIENMDLKTQVIANKSAIYETPLGSSSVYLKVGEIMTLEDLLYCLLIKSGNDAANVIAEAVSYDIDSFVNLMNKKVEEIGCSNTHFTNTHGFHDDNHYTTALDMVKIMKYCLQNETFKKIIQTQKYTVEKTNKTNEQRLLISTNKMFNKNYKDMYYKYIIGGKTGYTDEAQGTFIGYLEKDNKNIIVGVFDAPQDINSNEARFLDTIRISDYIFDDFNTNTIIAKEKFSFNIIDKTNNKKYTVGLKENITSLSENLNFRIKYNINSIIGKKYEVNSKIGTVEFHVENDNKDFLLENTYDLIVLSEENYNYFNITKYEKIFTIILINIFIILIFVYKKQNLNNKSKRNRYTSTKNRKIKRRII